MTRPGPAMPRRRLLGILSGVATGGLVLGGMDACGVQRFAPVAGAPGTPDRSRAEHVVRFGNWLQYIDRAGGTSPTLTEFTHQTGIRVDYSEPITGNEQFFGQIGIALAMGRYTGYDLVVLTDWMVAQLIQLGWAEPLSGGATPNASRLVPELRDWPVPDVRRYSLPWQAGLTGIVYNAKVTGRPITSMRELLTAPDLRGKVSLVTDMRDVMALVMLDMGIDIGDFTSGQFRSAVSVVERAVRSGQVGTVSNYYPAALERGSIAAGVGWAGDVLFSQATHPQIEFAWPAAGGLLWSDNMMIPARARHRANAERLMDFYYQPEVAAQLSAYQRYVCPVEGAQAAMRRVDPALSAEPYIFPTPGLLRNGHYFKILTPQQSAQYVSIYESAVGL